MISRPDVDSLMAGPLGDWLTKQAAVRQAAQENAVSRWWTAALVGLPLLAFLWILLPFFFQVNLMISFLVAGGGYAWGNAPRRKAIRTVKSGINEAIAKALDLQYAINVEPGEPFALARRYQLVPSYDKSKFEDHWHGNIGERAFSLHEAHLKEERGSGDNRRTVTVFKGSIIALDFAREFHGTTLVERAKQHRKLLGLGGRKDSVKFDGHRLDFVDMVHPDFDEDFCVFSDDQVESRYLVHPEYVERLVEVRRAFDGSDIRALFTGGELVIAVETDNLFESGSIEAQDDRAKIAETVEQFTSLANLAQSLNEPERGYAAA